MANETDLINIETIQQDLTNKIKGIEKLKVLIIELTKLGFIIDEEIMFKSILISSVEV